MDKVYVILESVEYENTWIVAIYNNEQAALDHIAFEEKCKKAADEWIKQFRDENGYISDTIEEEWQKMKKHPVIGRGLRNHVDGIFISEQTIETVFNKGE